MKKLESARLCYEASPISTLPSYCVRATWRIDGYTTQDYCEYFDTLDLATEKLGKIIDSSEEI